MNFGTPVPLLLGILMVLGAVALFFLDKFRPGYEREYDKVYAVLFLISGIFFLGQLTMELIPSFQQIIMVGLLISLTIQNIRSRKPVDSRFGAQAAPDMSMGRESYRPSRSSRGYGSSPRTSVQAELDRRDIPPDRRYSRPMLSGYDDQSSSRGYNRDAYEDSNRPRSYDREDSDRPRSYDRDTYGDRDRSSSEYNRDAYQGQAYKDKFEENDSLGGQEPPSDPPSSYYSSTRPDARIRRRRPRTRGDVNY
ncbi:MAG TPA: Ycf66 family protein [Trichocoleus sp.]